MHESWKWEWVKLSSLMDFKCTLGAFCYLQMRSFLEIDIFENLCNIYICMYIYNVNPFWKYLRIYTVQIERKKEIREWVVGFSWCVHMYVLCVYICEWTITFKDIQKYICTCTHTYTHMYGWMSMNGMFLENTLFGELP